MKNTNNVIDRFKKAITNNRFKTSQELKMMKILDKKFDLITVSEYGRREGISQPAASKRLKTNKVPYIILGGSRFVIGAMN